MRKNKLISVLGLSLAVVGLTSCGEGEVDTTLYKLTLSTNIDEKLTEEQKGQLQAVYGYGQPGHEIVEGVRPQEDIEELKKAGATDEDIAKVGKRQSDGSYYFYEQDPIYIKTPTVEGYYLDAMYYKGTNNLAFRPGLTKGWDQTEYTQSRWNMDAKNVELEARYKESSYHPVFKDLSDDVTNPNTLPQNYSFVADGEKTLAPATSSNPHKRFVAWTYQKYVEGVWTTFQISSLPKDYEESTLDIGAIWEIDTFKINFAFELDIGETSPCDWVDVCNKIMVKGNLTTVDGQTTLQDVAGGGPGVEVTPTSVVETPFTSDVGGDPWIDIEFTSKTGYKVWAYSIDGGSNGIVYDNHLALYASDFTKVQSTITLTFVEDIQ